MWGQYLLLQGHGKRKRKFFSTVLLPHSQPGASPSHLQAALVPEGRVEEVVQMVWDGVGREREGD